MNLNNQHKTKMMCNNFTFTQRVKLCKNSTKTQKHLKMKYNTIVTKHQKTTFPTLSFIGFACIPLVFIAQNNFSYTAFLIIYKKLIHETSYCKRISTTA